MHVYGSEEAIPDDSIASITAERTYVFAGDGAETDVVFREERVACPSDWGKYDFVTLSRGGRPFFTIRHTIDEWLRVPHSKHLPEPKFDVMLPDMSIQFPFEDGSFIGRLIHRFQEAEADGRLIPKTKE